MTPERHEPRAHLLDQSRVGEALHARSELGRQPREEPALVLEQQTGLAQLLEVAAELAAILVAADLVKTFLI